MSDPIEHVVVLMLENRSFDQMLGCLPGVDGVVNPPRSNPDDAGRATVQQRADYFAVVDPDPMHEYANVRTQLAGGGTGFVNDYRSSLHAKYPNLNLQPIMSYFGDGPAGPQLSVLQTLARHFLVCDRWFSSVPGPTWPNRFFVHSGTSLGHVDMPHGFLRGLHVYDQDTVYQRLEGKGIPWRIYHHGTPQSLMLTKQWRHPRHYSWMSCFEGDANGAEKDFPAYVFIEPEYFGRKQNDQHPSSHIDNGEALIAHVYNAIRRNEALWQKTLLVVLYDEHGGFYDHAEPPVAESPDGKISPEGCDFRRLGVRVPALLISPWVQAGVFPAPEERLKHFDHTSLLRYVSDKWGLPALTKRAETAENFVDVLSKLVVPRTDTPASIQPPAEHLKDHLLFAQADRLVENNDNAKVLIEFGDFLATMVPDTARRNVMLSQVTLDALDSEVGQTDRTKLQFAAFLANRPDEVVPAAVQSVTLHYSQQILMTGGVERERLRVLVQEMFVGTLCGELLEKLDVGTSLFQAQLPFAFGVDQFYEELGIGRFGGYLTLIWNDMDDFIFVPDPKEPLLYVTSDRFTMPNRTIAPRLMHTDGGSIPRLLRGFSKKYSSWGYAPAFILHDWIFTAHKCFRAPDTDFTLKDAALLMAEAMKTMMEIGYTQYDGNSLKLSKAKDTLLLMYLAVSSVFAKNVWEQHNIDCRFGS